MTRDSIGTRIIINNKIDEAINKDNIWFLVQMLDELNNYKASANETETLLEYSIRVFNKFDDEIECNSDLKELSWEETMQVLRFITGASFVREYNSQLYEIIGLAKKKKLVDFFNTQSLRYFNTLKYKINTHKNLVNVNKNEWKTYNLFLRILSKIAIEVRRVSKSKSQDYSRVFDENCMNVICLIPRKYEEARNMIRNIITSQLRWIEMQNMKNNLR